MRGSVFKRCTCPPRTGARGRRLACNIAHGSWSFKLDLPSTPTSPRRVVTRGGFASRADAEAELAAALARQ
ncbi:MAG: Integrase, partial [Frankiales bacterium]|nr:Integrase [Frankiales bacterium]